MENKAISVIITAESEVILKKKQAWSEVGLTVHNTNLSLEAKAKEAIGLLIPPITIDQIQAAELTLKDVKNRLTSIESERKAITGKFDQVASALMLHEKSVKDALPAYQNSIIAIKKAHEAEQAKILAAQAAERLAKENAINTINKAYNDMKSLVADQCQKAYEFALNKPITIDKLAAYLKKVKANKTEADFTIKVDELTPELFKYAYDAVQMASPADMLAYFHRAVDAKFEFYEVALKNKDAAIEASKANEVLEQQKRLEELANAAVAARLETISTSTDAVIDNGIKELKKKYEIDMDDSESSALLIITAFVTNFKEAQNGVRVTKWMNLSIGQMGSALAWMKNKDVNFNFTGINFKINDKL